MSEPMSVSITAPGVGAYFTYEDTEFRFVGKLGVLDVAVALNREGCENYFLFDFYKGICLGYAGYVDQPFIDNAFQICEVQKARDGAMTAKDEPKLWEKLLRAITEETIETEAEFDDWIRRLQIASREYELGKARDGQ